MKLICEVCKSKFTYKEILKNNFRLEAFKITCPNCSQEHMVKLYIRFLVSVLYMTPLYVFYLLSLKNNYYNIGLFILIAIGGYFISLFISPFIYKIKKSK